MWCVPLPQWGLCHTVMWDISPLDVCLFIKQDMLDQRCCDNLQHTIPASAPHLLVLLVCVQSISVDSVPVQPKCLIPRLKELLP